jgi:nucleotide-binding universal stress UspA family protein
VNAESNTIVVAIDRPEPVLITVSRDLARTYGARLILIHVAEHSVFDGRRLPIHPDERALEADLEQAAAGLREQGVDATLELHAAPLGRAAHVLADAANTHGAGLLVAGASRYGRISRLLHGGTLRRLEARAACPMLLVPLPAGDRTDQQFPGGSGGHRERAPRRDAAPRRGFVSGGGAASAAQSRA